MVTEERLERAWGASLYNPFQPWNVWKTLPAGEFRSKASIPFPLVGFSQCQLVMWVSPNPTNDDDAAIYFKLQESLDPVQANWSDSDLTNPNFAYTWKLMNDAIPPLGQIDVLMVRFTCPPEGADLGSIRFMVTKKGTVPNGSGVSCGLFRQTSNPLTPRTSESLGGYFTIPCESIQANIPHIIEFSPSTNRDLEPGINYFAAITSWTLPNDEFSGIFVHGYPCSPSEERSIKYRIWPPLQTAITGANVWMQTDVFNFTDTNKPIIGPIYQDDIYATSGAIKTYRHVYDTGGIGNWLRVYPVPINTEGLDASQWSCSGLAMMSSNREIIPHEYPTPGIFGEVRAWRV